MKEQFHSRRSESITAKVKRKWIPTIMFVCLDIFNGVLGRNTRWARDAMKTMTEAISIVLNAEIIIDAVTIIIG